jgi:hypothetical protein
MCSSDGLAAGLVIDSSDFYVSSLKGVRLKTGV